MRYFFREWRQAAGLTLKDVAEILGISEGHVSRIETNTRDFTGDYLEDFAMIVGCKNVCDPICKQPAKGKDKASELTEDQKLMLQKRLKYRAKEIRKLRRMDNGNPSASKYERL